MRVLDWVVLAVTLGGVVSYGLWRSRGCRNLDHYVLAERAMPWYAMALSIMATQASAVTFISTPGQAYVDGMRFVQFYFGLPLAMVILAFTAVPLFHRARVYTAYQYLEQRFDLKTGTLVSVIFLIQRGLALGVTLYAPAVVLSVIFGWPDWQTTLIMGGVAVAVTTFGGVKATAWSHMVQMAVMTAALVAALVCAVVLLPSHVSFSDAVTLAGASGKLNVVTTAFDWNDRYNLWSGLFGGMFLALAYFGTDQSQVQRYLAGKSIAESRRGLMFNAAAKIPMQLLILFIGAMVYVFYIYQAPPILFQRNDLARLQAPLIRQAYDVVDRHYRASHDERRRAADGVIDATRRGTPAEVAGARAAYLTAQRGFEAARREGVLLAEAAGVKQPNDTNYIFLTFVTRSLPAGIVGLVLAMILGAAMSSIASEMNALGTVSLIHLYQRFARRGASDDHYLLASRLATLLWGLYAVASAQFIKHMGSLVEAVNLLGSFFYGGMLGVFVLAVAFPRVRGRGAFWGVVCGEAVIFGCWYFTNIAFLWYNVIGCVAVVLTGLMITALAPRSMDREPTGVPREA
jgi:Na+/proline symporter